eukprot:TRINITY_DN11629_c0_g2_i1.p1 TRINITY_DN11629_c0_g2~~TRINITY_DN11629_c0_g2_i1.p1  ORF type:complete len:224 (-),score=55.23 TRINITY_DN11629_c0_g2_i1:43-714(-)
MSGSKITKFIGDSASVTYPEDTSVQLTLQGHSLTVPDVVIKGVFAVGVASLAYHVKDIAGLAVSAVSSVYCSVARVFSRRDKAGTAVIYGATGKIGRAFALKFAEEGMGLILIDYSAGKLNKLKEKIVHFNSDLEATTICCELDKASNLKDMQNDFSIKEVFNTLKKHKDITYFVNCRNVKQKGVETFHKQKSTNIVLISYYNMTVYAPVSYTHLTLPTICSV